MALYGVDAPSALMMSIILFSCHLFLAAIGAVFQIGGVLKSHKHASTTATAEPDKVS